MKVEYLIGIIILLVVILLLVIHLTKEGFTTDQDLHDQYSKTNQKKYNNVGIALHVTDNDAALGSDTRGLLGSIRDTLDSSNNPIQTVESDYPVEGGTSGMSLVIKKCEAITPVLTIDDCKKLDDPSINTTCGICLADPSDMGTNSEGSQWAGGLVLTAKDRDEYRKQNISKYGAVNGFLPDYSPTVGSCPAGRMVSTRAECEKLQKELTCQKGGTLGSPNGCSQCYNDNTYHIVDPSAEAGLILGAGKILVVGSGTVTWSETGQSNNGSLDLSPTILKPIPLMGGEYNPITLTMTAPAIPRPYDNSVTYRVNDLVIFNNAIFKMQEGAGVPGYSPDRPGDKLWLNRGAYSNYVAPPPTFIAGHLRAPDGGGDFQPIDLYRLILTDTITGRKPRVINQINVGGVDMTKMGAGFGQTRMNLTARSPFTFIDPLSQEATLCSNSPFVTQAQSSALLNSDPCYARGHNTPGTYSLECLQQVFQNNGCGLADGTVDKSGFPATNAKAAALMINSSGTARTMNEIIDTVYQAAVSTATGLDAAGNQLTLADWSKASLFCTGVAINSPCDANAISGPLSSDCITYLWDNEGENKIAGATYSLSSLARSLFSSGRTDRFCTRKGSKAPKNLNDVVNEDNMAYWKAKGGVAAVKAAMSDLHVAANTSLTNEDTKAPSILQCYGIVPDARVAFSSTFVSDTSVQSAPPPPPVPNLVLWFDAKDPQGTGVAPTDNALIKTWNDKSGNNNHAVSGNGVRFIASGMGGSGALSFSPSNDGSIANYFTGSVQITGNTMTIFSIINIKNSNKGGVARVIGFAAHSNSDDFRDSSTMALLRQGANSFGPYRGGNYNSNPVLFTPTMLEAWYDGSNQYSCVNGSAPNQGNGSGNFQIGAYAIGRSPGDWDTGSQMDGEISEIRVYPGKLTQDQRVSIEGALAWKWNIQGSLPSSHPYKSAPPVVASAGPVVASSGSTGATRTGVGWSL